MRAFVFGDNIDTDVIVPGRFLAVTEPKELAGVCMSGIRPEFSREAKRGDVIIAGKNFGSGSSREHAPVSIKALGISCVIAKSFARIFFRNAINIGLPVLESPAAADGIREGDQILVDLKAGLIRNMTKNECYGFTAYPESVMRIIQSGGLGNYIRMELKKKEGESEA